MTIDRDNLEHRLAIPTRVELRASGDSDDLVFVGHASTTEKSYKLYGGPPIGWHETIAAGAFKKTLSEKPDVVFLVNHDGLPLARTTSGTLKLSEDKAGLAVEARLDPADPDVQRIVPKIERGDLTEMSFAFRIMRQTWTDDDGVEVESWRATHRRILEVSLHRGDVSTVTYGANPHTDGQFRLEDALTEIARHDAASLATARAADADLDRLIRAAAAALAGQPTPARGMSLAAAQAIAASL